MFKEERKVPMFEWSMLGDVDEGRPNLGNLMEVTVYRLMQYAIRDVLIIEFGVEKADEIIYKAGQEAGQNYFKNVITEKTDFNKFIDNLQETLKSLKICVLRVEHADLDNLKFTLSVAEDLDCSGLPICGEEICTYDEGFIGGILHEFTGKDFDVKEIDCWCSGGRVCRFDVKLSK